MDFEYNKYEIILLDETDLKRLSEYLKENPKLWDKEYGHYHCMTRAIQYKNYKICCTQKKVRYTAVILTPDDIIQTECYYKNMNDCGIIESTGSEELDQIMKEVSFFFPLYSDYCDAWIIADVYHIEAEEFEEPYEEALVKLKEYELDMVKKYME